MPTRSRRCQPEIGTSGSFREAGPNAGRRPLFLASAFVFKPNSPALKRLLLTRAANRSKRAEGKLNLRQGIAYELYWTGSSRASSHRLVGRLEKLVCRMRAADSLQRLSLVLGLQLRLHRRAGLLEPCVCDALSHALLGRASDYRHLRRPLVRMAGQDRARVA